MRLKEDAVKYEACNLKDKKRNQKARKEEEEIRVDRCCQNEKTKQGKSKNVQVLKGGRRKDKKLCQTHRREVRTWLQDPSGTWKS